MTEGTACRLSPLPGFLESILLGEYRRYTHHLCGPWLEGQTNGHQICQRFPYPNPSRCTQTLALPSTARTQPSATPPAPPPLSLRVPSHSMTPNPADPRNVAHQHVVSELLVLCPQVLDLVGLMTRGCKPHGNYIVSTFLCPDYVICCPVYKSDPLYGLDLSLLLKGLTLQRYPVPRAYPGPPITGLHPGTDSDKIRLLEWVNHRRYIYVTTEGI